jgi:hypothetical protein
MAPYMGGKVPSIVSCIVDDHTVVDTFVNTLDYTNDQRNKGVHRDVGI